jgi:sigma-B regulation protein RsbU (phosphoserine phosphatase)
MVWVALAAVVVAVVAVVWSKSRADNAVRLATANAPRPPVERDEEAERAIVHVTEQAERLSRGETVVHGNAAARGAIESLERVATKVQQMTDARAHIVATQRDLDRARAMYRSILPLSSVGKHGRLHVAGSCTPAAETGGDWWTYRKLSGGRLLVVVGDATGHGVYSAMIGCAAHGAVEALSQVGEERLTPTSVLRAINAAIRIPGADHTAMTCFAALLDPKGTIDFANASHMLPLHASTDANGAVTKVGALSTAASIDRVDDSEVIVADIREGSQVLAPGDVVVLFTDGLTDRRDKAGRAFGHRRLQLAVQKVQSPGDEAGIGKVRDALIGEVTSFSDGTPPDDDVTLVVCSLDRA